MMDGKEAASVASEKDGENEGGMQEEREAGGAEKSSQKWWIWLWGVLFPQLSLHEGQNVLSTGRSTLVVGILYASHILSAWGDRMWGFAVSIFLALLYPGSLLIPGVYGFSVQLCVGMFGTVVGDWVDTTPRMRVAWMSLLIQNSLVALCAVTLALMFSQGWDVCQNVAVFSCLTVVVTLLGSGSMLATVANTISIEKDWVVVLADGNKDTLAALNSNMRRIDLLCKLLAPATTGVLLSLTGPFATTIIVASWNVVSFFGELCLLWLVYRLIPTLTVKKYRKTAVALEMQKRDSSEDIEGEEKSSASSKFKDDWDDTLEDTVEDKNLLKKQPRRPKFQGSLWRKVRKFCSRLLSPFTTILNGWKIYMKQDIVLVGFSLASLYLTVLGYSGVTATYFITQGVPNYLIGLTQGIGAVFGVTGTVVYPFVRKKVGTTRAGLFGISAQWTMLLFCVLAVVVPVERISSSAQSYYSATCNDQEENSSMTISPTICIMPSASAPTITHYTNTSSGHSTLSLHEVSSALYSGTSSSSGHSYSPIMYSHTTLFSSTGHLSPMSPSVTASPHLQSAPMPPSVTASPHLQSAPMPPSVTASPHLQSAPMPPSVTASPYLQSAPMPPSVTASPHLQSAPMPPSVTVSPHLQSAPMPPSVTSSPHLQSAPMPPSVTASSHLQSAPMPPSVTASPHLQSAPMPPSVTASPYLQSTATLPSPTQQSTVTDPLLSSPTPSPSGRLRRKRLAPDTDMSATPVLPSECVPFPTSTPSPTGTPTGDTTVPTVSSAVVLMLIGVIGARFGLWMFDLTVTQLVQERVVEEERGVVSGVMNAMNSLMDMLRYILVIAAPRPEHFRYLTFISVGSVSMGVLLYAYYVRKMRGHLFHFKDGYHRLKKKISKTGFQEISQRGEGEEEEEEDGGKEATTSLINVRAQEEEEEESTAL